MSVANDNNRRRKYQMAIMANITMWKSKMKAYRKAMVAIRNDNEES